MMAQVLGGSSSAVEGKGDGTHSENNTLDSTLPPDEGSPASSLSAEDEGGDMLQAATPIQTSMSPLAAAASSTEADSSGDVAPPPAEKKTVIASSSAVQTPAAPTSPPGASAFASPRETGYSSGMSAGYKTPEPSDEEDMESSSNDDSSYFRDPRNLPSPKSERRYSWASNNSAPPGASADHMRAAGSRESDASLSFSEDSDDGHHHHHHTHSDPGVLHQPVHHFFDTRQQQQLQQQQQPERKVTELFPQRITRMHSYSSLVESDEIEDDMSSDPSVREELSQVAVETNRETPILPSGRISPILGEHAPSRGAGSGAVLFSSPSSIGPQPSPPTIMSAYQQMLSTIPHPQPHSMTPSQLREWTAAYQQYQNYVVNPYGLLQQRLPTIEQSNRSTESFHSSLAYSDDSELSTRRAAAAVGSQGVASSFTAGNSGSADLKRRGVSDGPFGSSGGVSDPLQHSEEVSLLGGGKKRGGGDVEGDHYKVYWQRWIMLMYMSMLNLLSDWTCYSVAPIALLTEEALGDINPEQLVVIFLGANVFATACEPILLSRLGLRKTVLFGALLLMLGNVIKSGGMPPIIQADLEKGHGEWRVALGFFVVGLSQPLYQCTPALLSSSWFPERERTMATGVALNANQLGIGFAFVFGTLLVANSDDIPKYFGLLSILSTITFLGVLIQFDDAPPTPPSDTARVMRGTLDMSLPNVQSIFDSVRNFGRDESSTADKPAPSRTDDSPAQTDSSSKAEKSSRRSGANSRSSRSFARRGQRRESAGKKQSTHSSGGQIRKSPKPRRPLSGAPDNNPAPGFHGLTPSPALWGRVVASEHSENRDFFQFDIHPAPSPMNTGPVADSESSAPLGDQDDSTNPVQQQVQAPYMHQPNPYFFGAYPYAPGTQVEGGGVPSGYPASTDAGEVGTPTGYPMFPGYGSPPEMPTGFTPPEGVAPGGYSVFPPSYGAIPEMQPHLESGIPYHPYAYQGYPPPAPYWDPRYQAYMQYQQQLYQMSLPVEQSYYSSHHAHRPFYMRQYEAPQDVLPHPDAIDEGVEPVLTLTPHHLDIDIRDDQVILSIRACLSRPGFIHALVAFTVSGIVINTLSTFMDYLVRLNGAGREYTGIVGGTFQVGIMISSLIIGKITDRTRAYYSITIGMLVLGAFGLAECGVSLDENNGSDVRLVLICVGLLVGPLQPVSTELGVDVVHPLSENTVLVIQQLFSNLLSAMFIPCFKAMKDVGIGDVTAPAETRKPEYTFSFYLLILLHSTATIFFATFNGRYLRYEQELEKKASEERRKLGMESTAFHRVDPDLQLTQSEERLLVTSGRLV